MNNHYIYIVQEFIGKNGWRNIRAFTEEHHAAKYIESLQKEIARFVQENGMVQKLLM